MLAAAATALFVAPAASASWGVSRVGAVEAVVKAVTKANPIMTDAKYAPAESRRAAGRYRCSWLAVNTYSVLGGRARVHFVHGRPRVALRQTSCRRHVGPHEDSALVRCAEVGYEAGRPPRR